MDPYKRIPYYGPLYTILDYGSLYRIVDYGSVYKDSLLWIRI